MDASAACTAAAGRAQRSSVAAQRCASVGNARGRRDGSAGCCARRAQATRDGMCCVRAPRRAFVPAADDLAVAQVELEGHAALARAVELRAVLQRAWRNAAACMRRQRLQLRVRPPCSRQHTARARSNSVFSAQAMQPAAPWRTPRQRALCAPSRERARLCSEPPRGHRAPGVTCHRPPSSSPR